MANSTSANLSLTVAHAISFLTQPLAVSYSAATIVKLQLILEANLTALYAPSWVVREPLRSSGRRCLTLSPDYLPPRAIYSACIATDVQWFDWIALLGGREFDLFVDPGCVSVRLSRRGIPDSQMITIWADEIASPTVAATSKPEALFGHMQCNLNAKSQSKTVAQQLLEDDHEEDDMLFAMIADEISAPTWMTPILDQFPIPGRSLSPLSTISTHSRSSSRSSNSSSGFSLTSVASSGSITSMSTSSSAATSGSRANEPKQSRRERARQARVFVDTTKTEVTPYDGGKTTVLTGGVMLGGATAGGKSNKVARPTMATTNSWRSTRA